MTFNSQICTTREQSERLVAMGLKPETADMMWDAITIIKGKPVQEPMWSLRPYYYPKKSGILYENEEQVFIPAWSLHRLIEMMPKSIHFENEDWYKIIYNNSVCYQRGQFSICRSCKGDLYEDVANCIEWLIKEGYFNEEYLNKED